jgi:hypothetical protein
MTHVDLMEQCRIEREVAQKLRQESQRLRLKSLQIRTVGETTRESKLKNKRAGNPEATRSCLLP